MSVSPGANAETQQRLLPRFNIAGDQNKDDTAAPGVYLIISLSAKMLRENVPHFNSGHAPRHFSEYASAYAQQASTSTADLPCRINTQSIGSQIF